MVLAFGRARGWATRPPHNIRNSPITPPPQTQYRASLLKHRVVSTYSVKRDGSFRSLESPLLVPEDVVFLKGGQIVPADCRYLEGSVLRVR